MTLTRGDRIRVALRNGLLIEGQVQENLPDGTARITTASVFQVEGRPTNTFIAAPVHDVYALLRAE